MKYTDFETLISTPRLYRYKVATRNNTKKAMILYRANLRLSHAIFSVLSIFEIVLRNKIDNHYKAIYSPIFGSDEWLKISIIPGGFYDNPKCHKTKESILKAVNELGSKYTHDKLLAELNFGFWRFQFASKEFMAAGSTLHRIFPNRPTGTNHTIIFNKLTFINQLRNRIAHHEPICFGANNTISTAYAATHYQAIIELFHWLDIDSQKILYGIDKVQQEVRFINNL